MLLRIRSPAGTARITVENTTTGEQLAQLILDSIPKSDAQPDPSTMSLSNQPSGGETVTMDMLKGRQVGDMGFSHGDLLFLSYKPAEAAASAPTAAVVSSTQALSRVASSAATGTASGSGNTTPVVGNRPTVNLDTIVEPSVDTYWAGQTGKIERKRDPAFCRHGDKAMCDYCMPMEPYDLKYQGENQIKHLSYHAHLRKLLAGRLPSAVVSYPPLTPLSLSVVTPCPTGSHPSFPDGICSKCQPSALTLHSQPFRMVDHVEFATPALIDDLLTAWRRTGNQRFAFLIGHWDKYEKVPMGVKAVVEALWEPKQEGELDGLTIENPWEDETRVEEVASWCEKGLGVVGMIYTDLTPDPDDITKTLYKRHAQSYTASALEMLTSAQYQVNHPLPTKASSTGEYSSRFVTCCLTGTEEGGIDVIAWQASEQAEAMVKANAVEASVDPGIVRVRTAGDGEYIPEVFYSFKNEYGVQVKMPAKPTFPVEYLFVNITHGFPVSPDPLFLTNNFPTENRPGLSDQSMEVVVRDLLKILRGSDLDMGDTSTWPDRIKKEIAKWLSDWHLVAFLCMHGPFSVVEQKLVARASTAHHHPENASALEQLFGSPGWQTLLTIAESTAATSGPPPADQFADLGLASPLDGSPSRGPSGSGTPGSGGGADVGGDKACPHCTFINPSGRSDCEVCGLPL